MHSCTLVSRGIVSKSSYKYQNPSMLNRRASLSTVLHPGFNQLKILQNYRYLFKKNPNISWPTQFKFLLVQGLLYIARVELNNIFVILLLSEIINLSKNTYLMSWLF